MKTKDNSKGSRIKAVVVAVFLVALVLFYFYQISNKSTEKRTERQKTELETLENYDMVGDYPKTARDVVKLHCRFFKLFYGQSLSDEELESLSNVIRNLYSEELLSYNPENVTLDNLKTNIQSMEEAGYSYKSYELPEASQIQYYTVDEKECATMEIKVTVTGGYMYIQYVLVKENDQWKIQAWGDSQLNDSTTTE